VIENALVAKDALVIRPGLVVGDGGLIRSLYSTIRRGVVPLIDGGLQAVQVVGTDDLAAAIECAVQGELRGCHNVCAAEPVTTSHVARTLAKHFGIKPLYVYVPWPFAYLLATIAERLRIALPLTTENLLGMRSVEYAAPSPALAQLGWKARTWSELLPQLAFR
jgi:NAD dependent epimerase/dehydratase family enzyme